MTREQADELRRIEVDTLLEIAAALKKLAGQPVVLTLTPGKAGVWHEGSKAWVSPEKYERLRNR